MEAHHKQDKFSYDRPSYRQARWERAVKVYTVNQESPYLLIQGVPAVGVSQQLVELFALYGAIQEYRILDEYPAEEFTEVYWVKFQKIDAARYAKKKLDNSSFMGGILHVCYAPEYESVGDTRQKLLQRKRVITRKLNEDHHSMGANSQKLPATNDNDNDSKVDRTIGHKRKRKFNEYQESSSSQYPTVSVPNIPQLSSNKKTINQKPTAQHEYTSIPGACRDPQSTTLPVGSYQATIADVRSKLRKVAECPAAVAKKLKKSTKRLRI